MYTCVHTHKNTRLCPQEFFSVAQQQDLSLRALWRCLGDASAVRCLRKGSSPRPGSIAQLWEPELCWWPKWEAEFPHVLHSWSPRHCFWNIKHSHTSPSSLLARGMSMHSYAIPQIWYLTDSRVYRNESAPVWYWSSSLNCFQLKLLWPQNMINCFSLLLLLV